MKRILATLSLIASTIFGADISQDVESNTPTAQDKDIQVYVADQGTIAINFYTNGIARPIATNDVVYFWYATNELFSTHTAPLVNTGSSVFAFNDTYFPQPTPTSKPWTWGAGVNGKGVGHGNLRILRNPWHESGQLGLTNKIDWANYDEHANIGSFPLFGCNNMSVTNNGSELFICFTGGTGATAYATEAYVDAGDAATLVSANAYADAGDAGVSNYVDTTVADYLPLAGGTMTGELNMGGSSITNVQRIWTHDLIAEDVAVGGTLEVLEEAEFYGGLSIRSGTLDMDGNDITGIADLSGTGRRVFGTGLSVSDIDATAVGAQIHGVDTQGDSAATVGAGAYGAQIFGWFDLDSSAVNNARGALMLANLLEGETALITSGGKGSLLLGAGVVSNSHAIVAGNGAESHGNGSITAAGNIYAGGNMTTVGPLSLPRADFQTDYTVTGSESEGAVHWNAIDKTLDIHTGLGPVLQVGQELYVQIWNNSGEAFSSGDVVYSTGITNGMITAAKACAATHELIDSGIAVATMDIPDGTNGFVTSFGYVRGVKTDQYSPSPILYVSPTTAGELTNVKPEFPDYVITVGAVTTFDAVDGVIAIEIKGAPVDTIQNFWNGVFRETFDFRVTEAGGVITGALSPANGHPDMTMMFSDGFTMLTATPSATVVLTAGTDEIPQVNYVYIPKSTKVLTVSTTAWPDSVEHIKVAQILLQSATTTGTNGALRNQNWNDAVENTSTFQGHLSHITTRVRQIASAWDSGAEISATVGTGDEVWVSNTSGVIYQMHRQTFPALDMEAGDDINVVNDFADAYVATTNLASITTDASGNPLLNTSFSVVIWGVVNKTGEASHLMANMPTATYNKNFPDTAVNDASSSSVYTIPKDFQGVGFLMARLTFVDNAGVWSLYDNQDLRGTYPNTSAGGATGGGGVTSFTGLTDTPSSYIGQAGKVVTVASGETALEFAAVTADAVAYTNGASGLAATDVQAAVDELAHNRIAIVTDNVWTWYGTNDISVLTNMTDGSTAYIYGGEYEWGGVDHATYDNRIEGENISIIGIGRPIIISDLLGKPNHASGFYVMSTNAVIKGIDFLTYPDIDDPSAEQLHYGLTVSGSANALIEDCGIFMVSTSEQYEAKAFVGVNAYNTRVLDCSIGAFAEGYTSTGSSLALTAVHSTVTDRESGVFFDGCAFLTQPSTLKCSVGQPYLNLSDCRANSLTPVSGTDMKYAVSPLSFEGARASVPRQIRSIIDSQYYKLPFTDEISGFVAKIGYVHNELGDKYGTYQAGENGAYWEELLPDDIDRIVSLPGRVAYDERGITYEMDCTSRTTDICLAGEYPTEVQFAGVGLDFLQASNITCRVENMSFTQGSTAGNLFALRMVRCTNTVLIVQNCDFTFSGVNSLTGPVFDTGGSGNRLLVQNCRVALGVNTLYTQTNVEYLNCTFWEGNDMLGSPSFTMDVAGKRWAASASAPTGGNVKEGDYYYDTALNSPSWYNGATWDNK